MDLFMPGINGWQVTQILKRETDTAAIPIVVLTPMIPRANGVRCVREGCHAFVAKPCTPQVLAREVARASGQAPPAH